MNRNRSVILIAGLGTAFFAIGGLAVVLLLSPFNPFGDAAAVPDPQRAAVERLRQASECPPNLY